MSAYIAQLKRQTANNQTQALASPPDSLRAKHDIWFAALPYAAKHRHWSMEELSTALEVEPRELSQTLLDAGWLRKRIWLERGKGCGRYLRVWLPPTSNQIKNTPNPILHDAVGPV